MKKLLIAIVAIACSNSFAYYQAQQGRWLNRDPIEESGGKNIYGFVDNNPQNNIDELGLISSSYFKDSCSLIVTMKWRVKFKGKGWSDVQRNMWINSAKQQLSSYFSNQSYKCFPTNSNCCECKNGVDVTFNVVVVPWYWTRDYTVSVTPDPTHVSSMNPLFNTAELDIGDINPQNKGASMPQVPILHETGHMLGLDHPGGNSNSQAAYWADIDALMGGGNIMRKGSFTKAFCSQIKGGKNCKSWSAK